MRIDRSNDNQTLSGEYGFFWFGVDMMFPLKNDPQALGYLCRLR